MFDWIGKKKLLTLTNVCYYYGVLLAIQKILISWGRFGLVVLLAFGSTLYPALGGPAIGGNTTERACVAEYGLCCGRSCLESPAVARRL